MLSIIRKITLLVFLAGGLTFATLPTNAESLGSSGLSAQTNVSSSTTLSTTTIMSTLWILVGVGG